jgi:hypothetical protein
MPQRPRCAAFVRASARWWLMGPRNRRAGGGEPSVGGGGTRSRARVLACESQHQPQLAPVWQSDTQRTAQIYAQSDHDAGPAVREYRTHCLAHQVRRSVAPGARLRISAPAAVGPCRYSADSTDLCTKRPRCRPRGARVSDALPGAPGAMARYPPTVAEPRAMRKMRSVYSTRAAFRARYTTPSHVAHAWRHDCRAARM